MKTKYEKNEKKKIKDGFGLRWCCNTGFCHDKLQKDMELTNPFIQKRNSNIIIDVKNNKIE
jgi:hypothetical protein